jgi:hypothetical protein
MTSTAGYKSGYVLNAGASTTTQVWSAYSYSASADPLVLDECNGKAMTGGNYSYAYYVTPTFPYILGCLRGQSGSYVAATSSSTTTTTTTTTTSVAGATTTSTTAAGGATTTSTTKAAGVTTTTRAGPPATPGPSATASCVAVSFGALTLLIAAML